MCGDSTSIDSVDKLMDGKKADMVFTSPPYNADAKTGQGSIFNKKKSVKMYGDGYSDNRDCEEYIDFNRQIFAAMSTIAADRFTCCYNINYNNSNYNNSNSNYDFYLYDNNNSNNNNDNN